jgi:hypothetical protein
MSVLSALQALEYSHVCKYACSEEVPELQDMGGPVEGTVTLIGLFLFCHSTCSFGLSATS